MAARDSLTAPLNGIKPGPHRRRRTRTLVLAAVGAAVLGTAGTAIYLGERGAPAVLVSFGNRVSASATVGQISYVDSDIETKLDHGVDLQRITPRVARNDAGATVRVLVCARRPGSAGVGFAPLTEESCVSAKAFTPGQINLDSAVDQIIFEITPTRIGTLHIEGSEVGYRVDSRTGSQHAGVDFIEQVR